MSGLASRVQARGRRALLAPWVWVSCVSVAVLACGTLAKREPVAPPPDPAAAVADVVSELLPVAALEGDWLLRQRVAIRWDEREERFDAVLQKRGDALTLLGLGPMSRVGFSLRLDRDGVAFENRTDRALPFEPAFILADVQRVFFPWLEQAAACGNCERSGRRGAVAIAERRRDGRLAERRFWWPAQPERGSIVVRFVDRLLESDVPRRATLEHGGLGYSISIETLSAQRL